MGVLRLGCVEGLVVPGRVEGLVVLGRLEGRDCGLDEGRLEGLD